MSPPVDWDAAAYDRVADPQEEWGREVLARLELRGDETVLDAGCGSGRTTRLLLERLPHGRVIGVDASPAMIERARAGLAGEERVELLVADLLELRLDDPVDAVYSNAVFHWVTDHEALFARLREAMRAGARLEAQCGGQGNVDEFQRALEALAGDERFSAYLRGERQAWNFASVADTEAHLARAGFGDARVWLEQRRVTPRDPGAYLRAVGLNWHLARLPPALHDDFVAAVVGSLPRPLTLDYVRLNISAVRP